MLFNSIDFALFLPVVFALYWLINQKNLKLQNLLVLIASYFFYGCWDWRFLLLIAFSTLVDYSVGRRLGFEKNSDKRKFLLWISVGVNLGFLGFFKYYNFFIQNFIDAFTFFGYSINANTLNIILPVGISFYTFQTMSYTIDVYRGNLQATKDIIAFSAFVAFFPQLVAGPIERASNLLPQFYKKRRFNYKQAVDGLRQFLWGLFKKVVIANNCAEYANQIFNNYEDYNGSTLILGVIFFAFQVYGDFSGYSDMAIGTAKLFGFNLKQNFASPYFSRNIMEFWKRWHISLTSWLTDYIFTPLAIKYRHLGKVGIICSLVLTFLISGLWHGANWTFVIWGALHSVFFLLTILLMRGKTHKGVVAQNKNLPTIKEIWQMTTTFFLVCISYIFFRAESLGHATEYINKIFSETLFLSPYYAGIGANKEVVFYIIVLLIIEWYNRREEHNFKGLPKNLYLRHLFYHLIVFLIISNTGNKQDFIYFQF